MHKLKIKILTKILNKVFVKLAKKQHYLFIYHNGIVLTNLPINENGMINLKNEIWNHLVYDCNPDRVIK